MSGTRIQSQLNMKFCIWIVMMQCMLSPTNAFLPTQTRVLKNYTASSRTHKQIIVAAVRMTAWLFMNEYPEQYPYPIQVMSTKDFKNALSTFTQGVVKPDIEQNLRDLDSAHFRGEQINESNLRLIQERAKVLLSIDGGDMLGARDIAGQLLHTLQDFYSHSNWIEFGGLNVNRALGTPGGDIGVVATSDQPTCTDCLNETCRDNIKEDILQASVLTSGYMKFERPGDETGGNKPRGKGKCSHGGMFDITRHEQATGGINKDTDAALLSPHHYLHTYAANSALMASVTFLFNIREVRSDEDFARFLGLVSGSSLCFVMDTTGSMSGEIAAVRQAAIDITEEQSGGTAKPTDYVLAPFNDPEFGPLFMTVDPETFKDALGALTATGGGDGPELALSGMLLALHAVRSGSTCYVFTDARAKDIHLENDVSALARDKQVKITTIRTDSWARKKRSVLRRQKRQAGDIYERLATVSGGQVIQSSKGDIDKTLSIIDEDIAPNKINIWQADYLPPTGSSAATFSLPVDESISDLILQVTSDVGLGDVIITDPSGTVRQPVSDGNGTDVVIVTDTAKLKLYKVATPSNGLWQLSVQSSTNSYSIKVNANSLVDFTYEFVEKIDSAYGGYRHLEGKPFAGREAVIVLKVFGGLSPLDGAPVMAGLADLTALVLVAENGTDLLRVYPLVELEKLEEYEVASLLPAQGFRVIMEGSDHQGNKVQRLDTSVVTSAVSALRILLKQDGSYTVTAGESLQVTLQLVNIGAPDTYTLSVSDSNDYFQQVIPQSILLESNVTTEAVLSFAAPSDAPLGQVSTVSVTATNSGGTDSNFVVFRIGTLTKISDDTPPNCTITRSSGVCDMTTSNQSSCSSETWMISFTAIDSGLGIYSLRASQTVPGAIFRTESFDQGTTEAIHGNYTSDCCSPRIDIVASDILGNNAKCSVDYIPISTNIPTIPSAATTTTTASPTASTTISAGTTATTTTSTTATTTTSASTTATTTTSASTTTTTKSSASTTANAIFSASIMATTTISASSTENSTAFESTTASTTATSPVMENYLMVLTFWAYCLFLK